MPIYLKLGLGRTLSKRNRPTFPTRKSLRSNWISKRNACNWTRTKSAMLTLPDEEDSDEEGDFNEEFMKLAKWKRDSVKKKAGIF